MPAPTPVAEKYVNCIGSTFNVGGTWTAGTAGVQGTIAGGTNLDIMEGSYTHDINTDDMTNNTSGGWEEDILTTQKLTGSFKLPYKATSGAPPFVAGQLYSVAIFSQNGTASAVGTVRFRNVSAPVLNVKGGLVISFDIKNQGAMVITP